MEQFLADSESRECAPETLHKLRFMFKSERLKIDRELSPSLLAFANERGIKTLRAMDLEFLHEWRNAWSMSRYQRRKNKSARARFFASASPTSSSKTTPPRVSRGFALRGVNFDEWARSHPTPRKRPKALSGPNLPVGSPATGRADDSAQTRAAAAVFRIGRRFEQRLFDARLYGIRTII